MNSFEITSRVRMDWVAYGNTCIVFCDNNFNANWTILVWVKIVHRAWEYVDFKRFLIFKHQHKNKQSNRFGHYQNPLPITF